MLRLGTFHGCTNKATFDSRASISPFRSQRLSWREYPKIYRYTSFVTFASKNTNCCLKNNDKSLIRYTWWTRTVHHRFKSITLYIKMYWTLGDALKLFAFLRSRGFVFVVYHFSPLFLFSYTPQRPHPRRIRIFMRMGELSFRVGTRCTSSFMSQRYRHSGESLNSLCELHSRVKELRLICILLCQLIRTSAL